eukprot:4142634-Pyramimonas_sp.AAC.1
MRATDKLLELESIRADVQRHWSMGRHSPRQASGRALDHSGQPRVHRVIVNDTVTGRRTACVG